MALIRKPELLILDEPTTALDVITQDEILELIRVAVAGRGLAVLLITHDLSVVAQTCDRILVMYCGSILESASTEALLSSARHPYSQGLVNSVPGFAIGQRLVSIPGSIPQPLHIPTGCRFHPRCPAAMERCRITPPPMFETGPNHTSACWLEDLEERPPANVWMGRKAS
jgi:oligopeptide/dipeptide ABC transporter ATP-binding protein